MILLKRRNCTELWDLKTNVDRMIYWHRLAHLQMETYTIIIRTAGDNDCCLYWCPWIIWMGVFFSRRKTQLETLIDRNNFFLKHRSIDTKLNKWEKIDIYPILTEQGEKTGVGHWILTDIFQSIENDLLDYRSVWSFLLQSEEKFIRKSVRVFIVWPVMKDKQILMCHEIMSHAITSAPFLIDRNRLINWHRSHRLFCIDSTLDHLEIFLVDLFIRISYRCLSVYLFEKNEYI